LNGKPASGAGGDEPVLSLGSDGPDNKPFVGDSTVTDTQGTPAFFPPEAFAAAKENADSEEGSLDDDTTRAIRFDAFKQDAWAAGVTLYCLLFAQHPFANEETPTSDELFARITSSKIELPRRSDHGPEMLTVTLDGRGQESAAKAERDSLVAAATATGAGSVDEAAVERILSNHSRRYVSAEAEDLLLKLMAADPSKRLSVQEALQHPWIASEAAGEFTECPAIDTDALEPYESALLDSLREDVEHGGRGEVSATARLGQAVEDEEEDEEGVFQHEHHSSSSDHASGKAGASASGATSDADAEVPEGILDRGFLAKRGRIMKSWKRRWVLVKDGILYYFSSELPDPDSMTHGELTRQAKGEPLSLSGKVFVTH